MKKTKVNQKHQNHHSDTATCGNCWGHQEYGGEVIEKQEERGKKRKEAFILNFVKKYLT